MAAVWNLGYVTPENGTGPLGLETMPVSCEQTTKALGSRSEAMLCREAGWGRGWVLNHPWCSCLYLKAREKIAPQRAVMPALWQLLLLLVKLCNTVPTSLGWWQEWNTLVIWNTDIPAWGQELSSWEIHAHRAGVVGETPVKKKPGQVLSWCDFLKEALSCTCRKAVQLREAWSDILTGIAHSSCWDLHRFLQWHNCTFWEETNTFVFQIVEKCEVHMGTFASTLTFLSLSISCPCLGTFKQALEKSW